MPIYQENWQRPKRLLSLDGGGIRGVIAAEILLKLEDTLKTINPQWQRLSDYFDFISGTSTGSIIAAGLAKGMAVQEILNLYEKDGSTMFSKWWDPFRQFWAKYDPEPLEKKLQEVFENTQLGSPDLKTLLMIVTKNATTGKTWFFVNHPKSKFFSENSQIPLWKLIRASSAAPTFFPPYKINQHEFIDGGMSMFNNSSYQLFLEATEKDYQIGWETGKDKLLLVSIGTGYAPQTIEFEKAKDYNLINWAGYAVGTLMEDANDLQNERMKDISYQIRASGSPDNNDNSSKLLTYVRCTTSFSKERFQQLKISDINPDVVKPMDCVDQIPALKRIGQAIANEQLKQSLFNHLSTFLSITD
jgi:patatin-like phospholipase/acyl hydrolase